MYLHRTHFPEKWIDVPLSYADYYYVEALDAFKKPTETKSYITTCLHPAYALAESPYNTIYKT